MIKLLIVDDEPLVCIGVQSMLKWEEFDVEIVGTARNGQHALEMIEQFQPEIVITDIKMPLKNGLELAEECAEKYGRIPLFIILTCYEEFDYVRQAIRFQAADYLIKLELSPESLADSIKKSIKRLEEYRQIHLIKPAHRNNLQILKDKFFIQLYNNFFESPEQFRLQANDLDLCFTTPAYVAANCEITESCLISLKGNKLAALCSSTVQLVRNTLEKTYPCYVTILDTRHFSVAFCLPEEHVGILEQLRVRLQNVITLVHNYFNVTLYISVGKIVLDPYHLDQSYHAALRLLHETTPLTPLLFYTKDMDYDLSNRTFIQVRSSIQKAFKELDLEALHDALTKIADSYAGRAELRIQALDAACNIFFMATSLLPEGEQLIEQVFSEEPEGYKILYRLTTTDAIVQWILCLRDGCCTLLSTKRHSYQQQVIASVQEYICENLHQKLALSDIAAIFGFNPNYLSQLFSKYSGEGFIDYITTIRINKAKEMLVRGDGKIYEIAEKLGFESAFYFSKVFKKRVGLSPRKFIQYKLKGNQFHA